MMVTNSINKQLQNLYGQVIVKVGKSIGNFGVPYVDLNFMEGLGMRTTTDVNRALLAKAA